MQRARRPVVLVVDDGKHHVMLLRLALMQRGYAVIVVTTVEGAHTMVRERSVDALIATAPSAAAIEALGRFGEARPRVAIALATASTTDGEVATAAGFDLVIERPVDFGELDAALRSRLQRRTSGTRSRAKTGKTKKRGVA
jgi:DNA-binding response OmpR family regulator